MSAESLAVFWGVTGSIVTDVSGVLRVKGYLADLGVLRVLEV